MALALSDPDSAATHMTFDAPDDVDLNVDRRDWDAGHKQHLGK